MRKALLISVLTCFLLVVPSAQGHIFWSAYDSGNSKVGRADLDATNVNQELVKGIYFGQGVATDGKYVYWGESGSSPKFAYIGRAGVDGSEPNHAFQYGATYCGIFDIVATPSHISWLKSDCSGLEYGWDIDRAANVGGTGEYTEVGSGSYVCGFDLDANYVYWSEKHFIVRAPLPGPTLPEREWLDVGASVQPCAVAVDSGHVYWTTLRGAPTYRGTDIGRASIDGSEASVQNAFISGASFTNASGIDVAGDFIYWTNAPGITAGEVQGYIGRASTDGTGVAQFFIGPLFYPNSIDVDAGGAPPAPPGSHGTGIPPAPPGPPLIVGVSSSNSSWAPGGGSTAVKLMATRSKKSVPRGTVFSYRLDQDAAVTIEVKQAKAGRLAGKKCKKPTKANAKKKKCDLLIHTLSRSGKTGANEVPYTGRVKGKALKPGRHVAVFTATGTGGKSKSASVSFRIVKP